MAEPRDPSLTGAAVPTAEELFDPAAFAFRLAEARERRSRVLAGRTAEDPASTAPDASGPPLHRLRRGFALGLCLGLAVAVVPAASLLRLAPAPEPVAATAVRSPVRPASTLAPPLPAAGLAAMTPPAAPAQFPAVSGSPSPVLAPLIASLEPVSRPQPRPSGLHVLESEAGMSARNRPPPQTPAGLLKAILGGLTATPARLTDGPIVRSIDIRELSGKLLETPRKIPKKAAVSGKRKPAAKAGKSKASKGRKSSRKR